MPKQRRTETYWLDELDRVGSNRQPVIDAFRARLVALTEPEWQVLVEVLRGRSNADIAELLAVPQKTIEARRYKTMQKLQCGPLAELIRMMILAGY